MTVPQRAANWRKSSYSQGQDACVEVRLAPEVGVRDTKDSLGGQLAVPAAAWQAVIAQLRQA